MLDEFWENLGSNLAERGLAYLFSPAFLYFLGGLALYVWKTGWHSALDQVGKWHTAQQIAVILAVLLLVMLAAAVMQSLRFTAIRLLEGYWVPPFHWLARALTRRLEAEHARRLARLRELHKQAATRPLNAAERQEQVRLEMWLHWHPVRPEDMLPTALGNILRARERAPERKYGLEAVVCWPRLWLLLPDRVREDLTAAREALAQRAELTFWGIFFLAWAPLSLWAIAIAAAWAILAYSLTLQAAMNFGDLLESAFDLHRGLLYEALGWEKPATLAEERAAGQRLSAFLWRGTT